MEEYTQKLEKRKAGISGDASKCTTPQNESILKINVDFKPKAHKKELNRNVIVDIAAGYRPVVGALQFVTGVKHPIPSDALHRAVERLWGV